VFAPVRYLSEASAITSPRIRGIRRVKTNLVRESERVREWLVEVRTIRVRLNPREDHERRTKYTISTMTRITMRM
jgi:hypothetical protein